MKRQKFPDQDIISFASYRHLKDRDFEKDFLSLRNG